MVDEMNNDLSAGILLVDSLFMSSLLRSAKQGTFDSSMVVKHVGEAIQTSRTCKLVFPMHVHSCHWIVGAVYFTKSQISYGEFTTLALTMCELT